MSELTHRQYMDKAMQARGSAYAPYSRFRVGACAVDENGRFAIGCNVENASYGAAICAERNAIGAAIASGLSRIVGMYIASDAKSCTFPCGICRQVLYECNPEMTVYVCGGETEPMQQYALAELLPHAFSKTTLT